MSPEDARRIAPKLFGHPVAVRLAAGLLGDHGAEYLEKYPRELILLRRDLARVLLQDLRLGAAAERLMETLALAAVGLPASTIAAGAGLSDEEFQQAVSQCARAGLITVNGKIQGHPLFGEYFWHRLHRSDYQQRAAALASAVKEHITSLDKTSVEFTTLLPVAFRLFAVAGKFEMAAALRRDLSGELEAAAVLLYNRRNYSLADEYITHVLDGDPANWRMRLYRARIRIRQEEWTEADAILSKMLGERRGDIGVLHTMGWQRLRSGDLGPALEIFTSIISRREHVASLRDAAVCLHKMKRNPEALEFLKRAKNVESENPFVLDLESRILEDTGELEAAYGSALLAAARDPLNAHMHNRLGLIRSKQGMPERAIEHFRRAIECDSDFFSPVISLTSAYLDIRDVDGAEAMLGELQSKARTPGDRALMEHTKARIAFLRGDLEGSKRVLEREIAGSRNVEANLGLLTQVECALFDQNAREFPTIAAVALASAEQALNRIEELDPANKFIEILRSNVLERRQRRLGLFDQ